MTIKKICFFTATRAEYGLLRWLMEEVRRDPELQLSLIVSGTHLSEEFGNTYEEIEKEGFFIDEKIPLPLSSDSEKDTVQIAGQLSGNLATALSRIQPDCLIVLGDRYELLSVISACVIMKIPIAHISGGEITEGAIDDQIRHAVTKCAHFHYVSNETYADRVKQMGEEAWRICITGEPGLDNMQRLNFLSKGEIEKDLGIDLSIPTALVTFHPTTLEGEDLPEQVHQLMAALEKAQLQYIFTFPNADPGNKVIRDAIEQFVSNYKEEAKAFASLGQLRYLSLLQYIRLMIGNSSSGIVESAPFNIPVVNIGTRQKGRLCSKNVFHTGYPISDILYGIQAALEYSDTSCETPYGDGNASAKIKEHLKNRLQTKSQRKILIKKFCDCSVKTPTNKK